MLSCPFEVEIRDEEGVAEPGLLADDFFLDMNCFGLPLRAVAPFYLQHLKLICFM